MSSELSAQVGVNPSISTPSITSTEGLSSFQVIKRNGQAVPYHDSKIATAITKAILAVEGSSASGSTRVKETVDALTQTISANFYKNKPEGSAISIEEIQDQVELGLMRQGLHKVARAYVLYREEHSKTRASDEDISAQSKTSSHANIKVLNADGSESPLNIGRIKTIIHEACASLDDVNANDLFEKAQNNLYNGIKQKDIATALIMAARTRIEEEPNYGYVSARLLLDSMQQEACQFLDIATPDSFQDMKSLYADLLSVTLNKGVELELMSADLLAFDLKRIAEAIRPERDFQFTYLGLQTLYDRYFIHWRETRFELPQIFFMRVSMGLALLEDNPTERAIEFYHLLSTFDYMCSTPTLFNAGTNRPQLSSCYLTTIPDDLAGIYDGMKDNALLSKWAGGLGNDWTPVRALGSLIKGTNGQSQGIIPFLKVVNDTAVAVNQGGKRKGAVCAYLESWHLDIEEFLELRKNTGDERRRTHDMNSANWIPDLFMKRVFEDKEWTLFSPNDVPDLHDLYGQAFETRYQEYETMAANGEMRLFKTVSAKNLWRKMLSMLFETGHPWITFKDPCNIRSPQQHSGVVHSSNLCTEITLNTREDEIAVCNLGSVNLVNHIHDGKLDEAHLQKTIKTAIRLLDNVIDINYYAVPQAKNANLRHRPIGMGIMGFQDALYALKLPYSSIEAVHFADQSMELISYYAIEASANLAKERGAYESYEGSLWSQDILPIDSLKRLSEERGEHYSVFDDSTQLNWQPLRDLIKANGMRNSNVMAIAPTATISNIVGVSQSIEPSYQNLFVKSNLSGEFTVVNPWLVDELKALGLWDAVMINDLKYYDGSLKHIERIPEALKARFATAFEIDSRWLIEAASRRQKWIDQGQSLNLYMSEASGKLLDNLYKTAWTRGLKTTYYLRSLGATHMEKTTSEASPNMASVDHSTNTMTSEPESTDFELNQAAEAPQFCSILDPECEACQ
ncbi:ribonucleoside-diphosphate reductase subunit alpha [Alkalimarinus alittae]|uniref:Ribonucleoside-diphosphate reductase n=1 Tax=Alkalimarinus alittae TaxID=2961619 RepID=A0ABY6N2M0_9ALTE|nr:ribonucleoside-diphosphate reductase subunit alpha [Alkalimarinus alittae]UZE96257.1 ribonucleoside-diphosphate reductase subunit alpha [Alkalimarinus alittae]